MCSIVYTIYWSYKISRRNLDRRLTVDVNNFDTKTCECGHPERWAADPTCPVEFDERMNEYNLVHDKAKAIMRYCYWCGGRLPDSKRGNFFTTPSEEELAEVRSLFAKAKTADDVLHILGSPDETHDWKEPTSPSYVDKKTIRWKRTFRYSTLWKTLILVVYEMPDGKITFSWYGHYIGEQKKEKTTDDTSQWWQFWRWLK